MAGYDPQRTRHRPRPDNGSEAPVDSILDGPVEPDPADASSSVDDDRAPVDEAAVTDDVLDQPSVTPTERPTPSAIDLTTVPPPPARPSPARLVVGGGVLALLLALLWWRLRSQRTAED